MELKEELGAKYKGFYRSIVQSNKIAALTAGSLTLQVKEGKDPMSVDLYC